MPDEAEVRRKKKLEEGRRRLAALREKKSRETKGGAPTGTAAAPSSQASVARDAGLEADAEAEATPATAGPRVLQVDSQPPTSLLPPTRPPATLMASTPGPPPAVAVLEDESGGGTRPGENRSVGAAVEVQALDAGSPLILVAASHEDRASSPGHVGLAVSGADGKVLPDSSHGSEDVAAAAQRVAGGGQPVAAEEPSGAVKKSHASRWFGERDGRMRVVLAAAREMESAVAALACASAASRTTPRSSGRAAELHALLRSSHEVVQRLEGAGITPACTVEEETAFPAVSDVLQQLRVLNEDARQVPASAHTGSGSAAGSEVAPLGVDGDKDSPKSPTGSEGGHIHPPNQGPEKPSQPAFGNDFASPFDIKERGIAAVSPPGLWDMPLRLNQEPLQVDGASDQMSASELRGMMREAVGGREAVDGRRQDFDPWDDRGGTRPIAGYYTMGGMSGPEARAVGVDATDSPVAALKPGQGGLSAATNGVVRELTWENSALQRRVEVQANALIELSVEKERWVAERARVEQREREARERSRLVEEEKAALKESLQALIEGLLNENAALKSGALVSPLAKAEHGRERESFERAADTPSPEAEAAHDSSLPQSPECMLNAEEMEAEMMQQHMRRRDEAGQAGPPTRQSTQPLAPAATVPQQLAHLRKASELAAAGQFAKALADADAHDSCAPHPALPPSEPDVSLVPGSPTPAPHAGRSIPPQAPLKTRPAPAPRPFPPEMLAHPGDKDIQIDLWHLDDPPPPAPETSAPVILYVAAGVDSLIDTVWGVLSLRPVRRTTARVLGFSPVEVEQDADDIWLPKLVPRPRVQATVSVLELGDGAQEGGAVDGMTGEELVRRAEALIGEERDQDGRPEVAAGVEGGGDAASPKLLSQVHAFQSTSSLIQGSYAVPPVNE